jgi:WD40 repeat protein
MKKTKTNRVAEKKKSQYVPAKFFKVMYSETEYAEYIENLNKMIEDTFYVGLSKIIIEYTKINTHTVKDFFSPEHQRNIDDCIKYWNCDEDEDEDKDEDIRSTFEKNGKKIVLKNIIPNSHAWNICTDEDEHKFFVEDCYRRVMYLVDDSFSNALVKKYDNNYYRISAYRIENYVIENFDSDNKIVSSKDIYNVRMKISCEYSQMSPGNIIDMCVISKYIFLVTGNEDNYVRVFSFEKTGLVFVKKIETNEKIINVEVINEYLCVVSCSRVRLYEIRIGVDNDVIEQLRIIIDRKDIDQSDKFDEVFEIDKKLFIVTKSFRLVIIKLNDNNTYNVLYNSRNTKSKKLLSEYGTFFNQKKIVFGHERQYRAQF